MDIQKLLAEAQTKADVNGDHKLTADDVSALASKYGLDEKMINELKQKGDTNGDGKIDLEDLKSGVGQLQNVAQDVAKNVEKSAGGFFSRLFGKK